MNRDRAAAKPDRYPGFGLVDLFIVILQILAMFAMRVGAIKKIFLWRRS